ncbi:MAG: urea transporter [Phaeobacter gallaeciensis]
MASVQGHEGPSAEKARRLVEDVFLRPPAALLLIQSPLVGLGLWVPLLLVPSLAFVSFLALAFIAALDRFLVHLGVSALTMEFRANGLLAALVTYWVLAPIGLSDAMIVLAVATAVLVALYLVFLGKSIHPEQGLPVTVWPYCIVAAMILTLFSGMVPTSPDHFGWPDMSYADWSDLPRSFLFALGVFVFSPSILSGALIAILIALWSPVMFLTGVIGWLSGALCSIAVVSIGATVDWVPASYNSFLAGMALGAVFIVPGLYGLATASFAGVLAALVAAFFQIQTGHSGISYLPIPFIVTLYSGLATMTGMGLVGRDWGALALWQRPETARISFDWLESRWGSKKSQLLGVPVRGPVEITQGVDGPLTHRGVWKHALDFQRPIANRGTPSENRPSIWGDAVYAPVEGQVVEVQDGVADNPLGAMNYGENWGNFVVIESDRKSHVAVCHLMAGSIMVQPGQRVSFRTQIGRAGNSGRSSVPHIHMQRQAGAAIGSPTKPFRLANYFEVDPEDGRHRKWCASGLPPEQSVIAAATSNQEIHDLLTGMLPGRGLWTLSTDDPEIALKTDSFSITTSFTQDGLFRMANKAGEYFEASLDIDAFRVISVSSMRSGPMATLATAMSTIPYAAFPGLEWDDALYLPISLRSRSVRDLMAPLLGAPLTHVSSRLERMTDAHGAEFAANYRLRDRGREYMLHLHISPKRGPTRLIWESQKGLTKMELVSFEVHVS